MSDTEQYLILKILQYFTRSILKCNQMCVIDHRPPLCTKGHVKDVFR